MRGQESLAEYQRKITSGKAALPKISVWLDTPSASFVIISAYEVVIQVATWTCRLSEETVSGDYVEIS